MSLWIIPEDFFVLQISGRLLKSIKIISDRLEMNIKLGYHLVQYSFPTYPILLRITCRHKQYVYNINVCNLKHLNYCIILSPYFVLCYQDMTIT